MPYRKNKPKSLLKRILIILFFIFSGLIGSLFIPWNISNLVSNAKPTHNYQEAVERIKSLKSLQPKATNELCRLFFLSHQHQTDSVIVLVHGYTSCPAQFEQLGCRFYDLGFNVLITALPHHGLSDKMTEEHSKLKAEELAQYTDEAIDIATGLGKHTVVMGLSCGGVVAAWAAQTRKEVDLAVIVSPAFGYKKVPTPLSAVVMNLFTFLPDEYGWWNPVLKENNHPKYGYPRYSKRALAQIQRLGYAAKLKAQKNAPYSKKIIMVTNANDGAVNNVLAQRVVNEWKEKNANISTFEFPADLKLGHDIIDPYTCGKKIGLVYPKLVELVRQAH